MTEASKTKAEVFIIEFLKFDEETDFREGEVIYRALRMAEKNPIYHYVRTEAELEHFIDEFEKSGYRYLHISCHGSAGGVKTTLDSITIDDFAAIVGPALKEKRLFLSACLASTQAMADAIFSQGACRSMAGPENAIIFDDSVILWTSFYHLMFKQNQKAMKRDILVQTLSKCAALVGEKINVYTSHEGTVRRTVFPRTPKPAKRTSTFE